MSPGRSPALIIRFPPGTPADLRGRLVALLHDHDLVAIQEDDVTAPRLWMAYFASPAARDAARADLGLLAAGDPLQIDPIDVEDDDWARRTQADLPAIRIGRVIVAPPWDLPRPDERTGERGDADSPSDERDTRGAISAQRSDVVVIIEPSCGFGTGHHQSTRLCLVLLQTLDLAGKTAIDVGTGSGVLAIVAARLGAPTVSALDVDPDAIENARENIERNGVAAIVEAHVRDIADARLAPADLVIANLTGSLLAQHANALASLVRPSGSLVVAGFTVDDRALVRDAFLPALEVIEAAEEDDWWGFRLARVQGAD